MPLEIPLTFKSKKHENFWKKFGRTLEIILVLTFSLGLWLSIILGVNNVPLIIGLSVVIILTTWDLITYMKS